MGGAFVPTGYRPSTPVTTVDSSHNTFASVSDNGSIYIKSLTGGVYEGAIYWTIIYKIS